ncbi:MAG: nitrite reductase, copper-containing, partial [Xanthobacteraceae bacterium]
MASPSDRSSLKNWLPGVAGVVILFALAGYAGVSQGQREQQPTETAAATTSAKPEQPATKAVAEAKPAPAETKPTIEKAAPVNTAPPAAKTAAPAPAPAAPAP